MSFRDFARQPGHESLGVLGQTAGCPELLHVDLRLEIGRPEVAVDETRDVLVEPEAEKDVIAGERVRNRHVSLAADGRGGGATHGRVRGCTGGARQEPRSFGNVPIPCPGAIPRSSPTNGIPCRSTASRLIRRAAVFASATSRT